MTQGGGGQVRTAIEHLVARGRERGWVSYDEINRTIPPEHISCDEIEHLMARLDALGTAVVDSSGIGYDP